MVANTKGYIMKNLLPVSATQFPSPETSDGISFLYVLCRNILCIYSRESHVHILLSLVQIVLFWNIVIHLDLFTRQFILVINPTHHKESQYSSWLRSTPSHRGTSIPLASAYY